MNPVELIISLLAPHLCLSCNKEGPPLCQNCANNQFSAPVAVCYRCESPSPSFMTCLSCRSDSPLGHVWAATNYSGLAIDTVGLLKFQRVKAAVSTITEHLNAKLPTLPAQTIVSAVPTANGRVRMRGYDQAKLIAKAFAKKRGLRYSETLRRTKATRQVGAGRHKRFSQLEGAFSVIRPKTLAQKHILLIDDVLTTGATLESAAKILTQYEVKSIHAAVFARQPSKPRPKSSSNTKNDSI